MKEIESTVRKVSGLDEKAKAFLIGYLMGRQETKNAEAAHDKEKG